MRVSCRFTAPADVCAVDEDEGQLLTYNISTGRGAFTLAPGLQCGVRLVSTSPFNFEANATVDAVRITVCDDGLPTTCATSPLFSVAVLDVNEAPVLVYVVPRVTQMILCPALLPAIQHVVVCVWRCFHLGPICACSLPPWWVAPCVCVCGHGPSQVHSFGVPL
jgi:hypothetical protein